MDFQRYCKHYYGNNLNFVILRRFIWLTNSYLKFRLMKTMKQHVIDFVKILPGGNWCIAQYMHVKRSFYFSRMGGAREVFTSIYNENNWGNNESVSGHGSSVEYTENVRKEIPVLVKQLGIKSILDAPCGDYNWFRLIDREPAFNYTGGDIVTDLIKRNKELYENDNTKFIELDIIHEKLPPVELWLCRDCLFHFSYDDVFDTIHNFLESEIQYLLTSTHSECRKNRNITTGDFRLINLELPPFNFGKPKLYIRDWIPGYPVRNLGLWDELHFRKPWLVMYFLRIPSLLRR